MATNPYFNKFNYNREQDLLHNLVRENIQIHGIDVFYVPRITENIDAIFEEDRTARFEKAYKIEMYVESAEGFEGEGDFLSKFGVEIRDRVTFTLSRRAWRQHVQRLTNYVRPREGDLIFFPLNKKLFEIRFVEHESMFYNLGDLYTFQLQCELFEYSNEKIDTGIPDIDAIEDLFSTDVNQFTFITENGLNYFVNEDQRYFVKENYMSNGVLEDIYDNDKIQQEADQLIIWSEKDPFSELGKY